MRFTPPALIMVGLLIVAPLLAEEHDPGSVEEAEQSAAADEDASGLVTERERRMQEFQAMRERMRQQRGESGALRQNAMPRREGRGPWWRNEQLAAQLALDEAQQQQLNERHQAATAAQREAGNRQRALQHNVASVLATGDLEEIEALFKARAEAAANAQRAEDDWLRAVLEILNEEQTRALISEYPHALSSGRGGGRGMAER